MTDGHKSVKYSLAKNRVESLDNIDDICLDLLQIIMIIWA